MGRAGEGRSVLKGLGGSAQSKSPRLYRAETRRDHVCITTRFV